MRLVCRCRMLIGTRMGRSRVFRPVFLIVFVLALLADVSPAHATAFNLTLDPSTAGAPPAFSTAFAHAIHFYESTFSDPITINLHVGWGDINGGPLNPG